MNNLHRELAPISDKAWAEIEEEASRTLKRYLAARRVVDVSGPKGLDLSAVGTGHLHHIQAPGDGIHAGLRETKAIVELRVPFELARQAIDDVERGAMDSDWSAVKEAARKIAFAEDRVVFDGYGAAGIQGIRQGSSNPRIVLPANVRGYPGAIAEAVSQLRLAGVNGPYALVLGADAYTTASGGTDEGYPVFHHIEREVDGGIIWAPAIEGGFVLTTRSGDFALDIGQDISIGYSSHSSTAVELYFLETFTFRLLTTEAVIVLAPGAQQGS
ncbi:MAG TPA: family 1 encapsulin nanocompartment shell protein [Stellaceae bacterium]|nr:family 1 encapsulin nanocompartment shell protein [Stellaceae bacterium]